MNLIGSKLACQTCNAQAVVTRGGAGELHCHGQPMTVQAGAGDNRAAPATPTGNDHYDPFYD